jgi:hypothetical protein
MSETGPKAGTTFLVEGVDLGGLVGGDFHADTDLGNDGSGPLHDVSPKLAVDVSETGPRAETTFLVEGVNLGGLVGGDFHADTDLGNDGSGPLHGVSPSSNLNTRVGLMTRPTSNGGGAISVLGPSCSTPSI